MLNIHAKTVLVVILMTCQVAACDHTAARGTIDLRTTDVSSELSGVTESLVQLIVSSSLRTEGVPLAPLRSTATIPADSGSGELVEYLFYTLDRYDSVAVRKSITFFSQAISATADTATSVSIGDYRIAFSDNVIGFRPLTLRQGAVVERLGPRDERMPEVITAARDGDATALYLLALEQVMQSDQPDDRELALAHALLVKAAERDSEQYAGMSRALADMLSPRVLDRARLVGDGAIDSLIGGR